LSAAASSSQVRQVQAPVCLLINPAAGGGRAGRVAPAVLSALAGYGLQVRRCDTRDLQHARALALAAAQGGETVAVLSGDGMIGAVADVLRNVPDSLLALLPGGRGNDLVRVLGIPADPIAACAVVANGVVRPIDLGAVIANDARPAIDPTGTGAAGSVCDGATMNHAFVGIASAGFDSDANRIANEAPARLGNLVYAYGALRALISWRAARFDVQLEPSGERLSFSGYTIAAANSGVYGGGMRLAPDAALDDGLLDIVAIEHVSRLRFLASLPKVFKGAHVRLPSVRVLRAAAATISADRPFTLYADGDPIAELPTRVSALPAAVRVLVPR
jgi:YegS/Rv2252/BmrU family lipid kinase